MANIRKELVLAYVHKYNPSTVEELESRLSQDGIRSSGEDLFEIVLDLWRNGLISFSRPRYDRFPQYLASLDEAWWVYFIMAVSIVEIPLVVYQPDGFLLHGVRIVFGLGLLGYLPGYSTIRALFPGNHLPQRERVLLSVFLSVVVSVGLGVILGAGYFFSGASSTTLLSGYAIALTLIAAYRRYSLLRRPANAGQRLDNNR